MATQDKPITAEGEQWLTWPNLVTCLRLVASPGLIFLALMEQPLGMGCLTVVLVFTEWLDGFLARRLHQQSVTGARLDTIADAVFYSSLLVALVLVKPKVIGQQMTWISVAIASYLLSWLASWIKFGHLPSYHTWAAKGVWLLVLAGVVYMLLGRSIGPFRVAMVCVALANLEATAITLTLSDSRVDVPSLWHAHRGIPRAQRQGSLSD